MYHEKLSALFEEERKASHSAHKLKEFMSAKTASQKILSIILQTEEKNKHSQDTLERKQRNQ